MKRLHLVGKSKDNRRLILARTKGAKFGSFEVPISQKLLKLIGEVEDARSAKRAPTGPSKDPTPVRPEGAEGASGDRPEGQPAAASGSAGGSRPEAGPAGENVDVPVPAPDRAPPPDSGVRVVGREGRGRAGETDTPKRRTARPREAAAAEPRPSPPPPPEEDRRSKVPPRTTRPEIPARSKLSPAEIQGLIRAGRSVRTVARLAGTPPAWVKYLAEPIQQERRGVVNQMLRVRQTRSRLGESGEPIGQAVLLNLRSRGVASPDRVVEAGFTAFRPENGEWRVRLSFEHRGERQTALWAFDLPRRDVEPLNPLATRLGWRRPDEPGYQPEQDEGRPSQDRRARTTSRRSAESRSRSAKATRSRAKRPTRGGGRSGGRSGRRS